MKSMALILAAVILGGCASSLPNMVSTDVYSSKRDALVEQNKLEKEKAKTGVAAQGRLRERSEARHELVMKELATDSGEKPIVPAAKKSTDLITSSGLKGGFPAIVINDSACDATVTVRKTSGDYAGVSWSFDLKRQGGDKDLKLEADNYAISWSFGNSAITHPQTGEGDKVMTVHDNPRFAYGREKKVYYGAYRIKGWNCN